jgi:hypothetical protein
LRSPDAGNPHRVPQAHKGRLALLVHKGHKDHKDRVVLPVRKAQ